MPHLSTSILENIARAILAGNDLPADALVRSFEAEIARIGKRNAYLTHLCQECGVTFGDSIYPDDMWALLRATSIQRARAFLKAIE